MSLEKQLHDLKKHIHTVPPENRIESEQLLDLIWVVTDLEALELPGGWDLLEEDEKCKFLRHIIRANISNELIQDMISEEHTKRVKRRQEKEARGEHTNVGGV